MASRRARAPARAWATCGCIGRRAAKELNMLGVDFGSDAKRTLQALNRSLVIIEYSPDGTVLAANEKFCETAGYAADGDHRQASPHVRRPRLRRERRVPRILGQAAARRTRRERIQAPRQGRQGGVDQVRLPSRDQRRRPGGEGRQHPHRHHRRQAAGGRERRAGSTRSRAPRRSIEFTLDGKVVDRQRELPRACWATAWRRSRDSTTACSSTRLTPARPNTRNSGRN